MKVNLSNFNKFDGFSSRKRAAGSGASCRYKEPVHYKKSTGAPDRLMQDSIHLINEDKSKNTDMKRPAESISFGGSAALTDDDKKKEKSSRLPLLIGAGVAAMACLGIYAAKNSDKITDKLARSKTFHHISQKSDENEATIKALIALGLAGVLKPICVLAMPGAEEEDKQFTATKNAVSAVLGYVLSCIVFNPLSRGVNEFLNHPEKYIKDENSRILKIFKEESEEAAKDKNYKNLILTPEMIKTGKAKAAKENLPYYYTNYKAGMKTVYKNAPGLIVAPLKAGLTIALMPFILKFLFGDSKGRKKVEKQEQQPPVTDIINNSVLTHNSMQASSVDKVFDSFTKGGFQK